MLFLALLWLLNTVHLSHALWADSTVVETNCTLLSNNALDADLSQFCSIFTLTNVFDIIKRNQLSTDNYCSAPWIVDDYFYLHFECTKSTNYMTSIVLNSDSNHLFNGKLITSQSWPQYLTQLNLQSFGSYPPFYGKFNWSTITQLNHLQELNLENNNFSGDISDMEWNEITSMPALTTLNLADNHFKSNLSALLINDVSSFQEIQLQHNLFYGELNSDFLKFPDLKLFDITNNHFSGSIDWESFTNLHDLSDLLLARNDFVGSINWQIISNLSYHNLSTIHLDNNSFSGFADFHDFSVGAKFINIRLDTDIICDPAHYLCRSTAHSANRNRVECSGKADCEATCMCSDGNTAILSPEWNISLIWSSLRLFVVMQFEIVSEMTNFQLVHANYSDCNTSDILDDEALQSIDPDTVCSFHFDGEYSKIVFDFQSVLDLDDIYNLSQHLYIRDNLFFFKDPEDSSGERYRIEPSTIPDLRYVFPDAQPVIHAIWRPSFLYIEVYIQMMHIGDYELEWNEYYEDCSMFSDETLALIGDNDAICEVVYELGDELSLIRIELQSTATIAVDDMIIIKGDVFSYLHHSQMDIGWISLSNEILLPIEYPSDVYLPDIIASVPNQIGPCTDLVLDARSTVNLGGRDAVFAWDLFDGNDAYIATYYGVYVAVDYMDLEINTRISPLYIDLNVTNWYKASHSEKYSVELYTSTLIPMFQLHGISRYSSTNNGVNNIVIHSTILFGTSCDSFVNEADEYTIRWFLDIDRSDNDAIIDEDQLQLLEIWLDTQHNDMISIQPSMYLQSGAIYTFIMNIEHKNGDYNLNATHSLTTLLSDIKCNIFGGDISINTPIELDFFALQAYTLILNGETLTYDPDAISTNDHLTFKWKCFVSVNLQNETSCSDLLSGDTNAVASVLFDDELQLILTTSYSFRFVLIVSDATNSAFRDDCVDEIIFKFYTDVSGFGGVVIPSDDPFPLMISVIAVQNTITINDKIRLMSVILNNYNQYDDIVYKWSETTGLLDDDEFENCQTSNDFNLILKEDCLPLIAGKSYAFQLNATVYNESNDGDIAFGKSSETFIHVLNAPKVALNSFTLTADVCIYGDITPSHSLSIDVYSDDADIDPLLYRFYYEYDEDLYYLHPLLQSQSYLDSIYLPMGNVTLFVDVYNSKLSMVQQSIPPCVEFSTVCMSSYLEEMIANNTRLMTSEHDKYSFILQQSLVHLQYLQLHIDDDDACLFASLDSILNLLYDNIHNEDLCSSGFEILLTQTFTLWMDLVAESDDFMRYFYSQDDNFMRVYDLILLSLDPCDFISVNITYSNVKDLAIKTDSIVTNIVGIYYESNQVTSYLSKIAADPPFHHLLYSFAQQILDLAHEINAKYDEYWYHIYNLLLSSFYVSSLAQICTFIPGESSLIQLKSFSIYNTRVAHHSDHDIDILLQDIDVTIASDIFLSAADDIFSSVDLLMTVADSLVPQNVSVSLQNIDESADDEFMYILSNKSVSISLLGDGRYTTQLPSNVNITFPSRSTDEHCVWYNETANKWQNDGCSTYFTGATTICSCSHLTTFATIDKLHSYSAAENDKDVDEFIGKWLHSDAWNICNLFACILFATIFTITLKDVYPFYKLAITKKKMFTFSKHRAVFAVSLICISALFYAVSCIEAYLVKISLLRNKNAAQHLKIYTFFFLLPQASIFLLFTLIFYSWFRLAHSRIANRDKIRMRVRYSLYLLDGFIWCFFIVYYILTFVMEENAMFVVAAYIWSIILSMTTIFITIYAALVNRLLYDASQLSKGQSFASQDWKMVRRLLIVNTFITFYFVFQAFTNILFAYQPNHQSVIYSAIYSFIDAVCLMLIYWMYRSSVKNLKPKVAVQNTPGLQFKSSGFLTRTKGTNSANVNSTPKTPQSATPASRPSNVPGISAKQTVSTNTLNAPTANDRRQHSTHLRLQSPSVTSKQRVSITPSASAQVTQEQGSHDGDTSTSSKNDASRDGTASTASTGDDFGPPEPQSIVRPQARTNERIGNRESLVANDELSIISELKNKERSFDTIDLPSK